jgi:hypothetical protein
MNSGTTLQVSRALSLRLKMEEELESNGVAAKEQLDDKGWVKQLYESALMSGRVQIYEKHGMSFEYALVSSRDIPVRHRAHGRSFSHCLYNKFEELMLGTRYAFAYGSWLLFVVNDTHIPMPDYCLEYAAVYECGHWASLGNNDIASKLVLMVAKKEHKLSEYLAWLKAYYPTEYSEVSRYQDQPEGLSDDFQKVMESFFRF